MLVRTLVALTLSIAPAAAVAGDAPAAFTRADRGVALDNLIAAIRQHSHQAVADELIIQLRANRPYFMNLGDRVHFASAIDQDVRVIDASDPVVVRLGNPGGTGTDLGSGLFAFIR